MRSCFGCGENALLCFRLVKGKFRPSLPRALRAAEPVNSDYAEVAVLALVRRAGRFKPFCKRSNIPID